MSNNVTYLTLVDTVFIRVLTADNCVLSPFELLKHNNNHHHCHFYVPNGNTWHFCSICRSFNFTLNQVLPNTPGTSYTSHIYFNSPISHQCLNGTFTNKLRGSSLARKLPRCLATRFVRNEKKIGDSPAYEKGYGLNRHALCTDVVKS